MRTKFRPVPLHWHFCYRAARGVVVEDLLDPLGKYLEREPGTLIGRMIGQRCAKVWRGRDGSPIGCLIGPSEVL